MMVLVFGRVAIGCVIGVGLLLSACLTADEELVDGLFTGKEWELIQTFRLLDQPLASPTNKYANDDRAATLGQKLFFEKRYSGSISYGDPSSEGPIGTEGMFGCVSCHDPKQWFIDTRSMPNKCSVGAGHTTRRNSPSMVNIAFYEWGGWAGAQDTYWKQGANAPETKDVNGDRLRMAHMLYQYYRDEYNALFEPDLNPALEPHDETNTRFPLSGTVGSSAWEGMDVADQEHVLWIMANVGKSLEAYERLLISRNASFDRYASEEFSALSASAKRGLKLFIGKAGCHSCHNDHTFTDQDFHNTAVAQMTDPLDNGRYDDVMRLMNPYNAISMYSDDRVVGEEKLAGLLPPTEEVREEMRGQFRTKSLRHVAETGPYFHNGGAATLEEVIQHYNQGGATEGFPGKKDNLLVPLNLSQREIDDLVAFLKSLTGEPVPQRLTIDITAPATLLPGKGSK